MGEFRVISRYARALFKMDDHFQILLSRLGGRSWEELEGAFNDEIGKFEQKSKECAGGVQLDKIDEYKGAVTSNELTKKRAIMDKCMPLQAESMKKIKDIFCTGMSAFGNWWKTVTVNQLMIMRMLT